MFKIVAARAALSAFAALSAPDAQAANVGCRACQASAQFYEGRDQALAWTGPANVARFAELLEAVRGAQSHGLDPADYHLSELEAVDPVWPDLTADVVASDAYLTLAAHLSMGRLDPQSVEPEWTTQQGERDFVAYLQAALENGAIAASLAAIAPAEPSYDRLRVALAQYRSIAADGPWPLVEAGPPLHDGDRSPRVVQLRARLEATGEAEPLAEDAEALLFDEALVSAVQAFQRSVSLDPDGVVGARTLAQLNITPDQRVGQLLANLERWRWLPEDLGRRHIRVNIADFSLEARNNGVVERRHDVIVGRDYRRTPVFSAPLVYVIVNPWWETPYSLAVRDELPAFQRDREAVTRLGFQVIDQDGVVVDPATIDWTALTASTFPYRLRQAPGPLNALGEVKLIFPNRYNVYLHDTPTRDLFARARRAFSSGCVRVRDPLDLTAWVLAETPGWTPERLAAVAAGTVTTPVTLAQPIPVHILYWTAVPDEVAGVRFVPDLYQRDGRVLAALNEAPPPLETP